MTLEQHARASEGRDYWHQYVRLNGYAFATNDKGLKVLSRNLDISVPHLRRCIHAYLSA
jgi:rRNA-processing protein FCF1